MKKEINKKPEINYLAVVVFIAILAIGFLFVLNNRYETEVYECQKRPIGSLFDSGSSYMGECVKTFDKWTGKYK